MTERLIILIIHNKDEEGLVLTTTRFIHSNPGIFTGLEPSHSSGNK